MNLGPAEIAVVFLVALLAFGPKKLPELSRQVGRGMKELRRLQHTLKGELDDLLVDAADDEAPPPRQAVTDDPKALDQPVGDGPVSTLDGDGNADAPRDTDRTDGMDDAGGTGRSHDAEGSDATEPKSE